MTISDTFLDVTSGPDATAQRAAAGSGPEQVVFSAVRDRAAFAALRPEWDRLVRAAGAHPFADHAYVAAWLDSYGAGRALDIRLARAGGRLAGILPLCRGPGPGARTPLAHDRSGLVGPILHPALAAPGKVLAALLRCRLGSYHLLEPVEEAAANALWHAAGAAGLRAELRQVFTASSADLSGGGDAWRASLGKNARRSLTRAAKALEGAEARWISSADGQYAAAEAFLRVAETSWKAGAGTGFAGSPDGYAFLRGLARNCDPGALHFAALFHGDTPVAGTFSSIRGDTLYLNSVEFNENMAQAGPGRFAMCRIIETAARMGLARVDMMRTSSLNRSVARDERPLFRVTLHRRGDPTVHLRRVRGLKRRLARAGTGALSPRARYKASEGGDEA